jgi:hypothetical protein
MLRTGGQARGRGHALRMSIKALLLSILAACNTDPTERPANPPGTGEEDGQHFCCTTVDSGNKSGEGCVGISKENINACSKVLYCSADWTKDDGVVRCL